MKSSMRLLALGFMATRAIGFNEGPGRRAFGLHSSSEWEASQELSVFPRKGSPVATTLQATARSLCPLIIAAIAIAFCAACNVSNRPGSAIPISPANQRIRHLSQSGVVVDPSQVGPKVSTSVLGATAEVWFDVARAGLAPSFVQAGMATTRWPGGHAADRYHWRTNTFSRGICGEGRNVGKPNPNATFNHFMQDLALPAHLDVAITVNYGSNAQCDRGANPKEAADWVKYANNTQGYNITWWTVGNEQYTQDSLDLHSKPHDPSQYARIEKRDFYQQMKAASRIPIKVCVDASIKYVDWDATVFAQAKYDCVEVHFYPQNGTSVSDAFLLKNAVQGFTQSIQTVQSQLATAGRPKTPIYVGEIGSALPPGDKQNMSITQALYAGQIIGEMLNEGIPRSTWHSGFGTCDPESDGGDFSKSLYGWQNFGGTMIFSTGTRQHHCSHEDVPLGTLMPTAVTYEVASQFVRNGERMLGASVVGMPDVRAYATTYKSGYALMLFNLNETSAENVPVTIDGKTSGSGGPVWTYDKALYNKSKKNKWVGPKSSTLPSWQNSFNINLPPWSMIVVRTM
jgi:hypothetical protein